jgi:hypothetical protein
VAIEPLCGSIYIYIYSHPLCRSHSVAVYVYIYIHIYIYISYIYIYIYEIRMPDSSHFVAFRHMCIYICAYMLHTIVHMQMQAKLLVQIHVLYTPYMFCTQHTIFMYSCSVHTIHVLVSKHSCWSKYMSRSMSRSAGRSGGPLLTAGLDWYSYFFFQGPRFQVSRVLLPTCRTTCAAPRKDNKNK